MAKSLRFSMRWPLSLAVVAMLGACAGSPEETQYFLLPQPKATERIVFEGDTVALRELDLPLYARSAEIAYIGPGGSIILSDDHRWADAPARAATRALGASLRDALDTAVVIEPWSRSVKPVLRIDVTVDRFIGTLGGDVDLSGEFQIVQLDDRKPVSSEGFDISSNTDDAGFDALTRAHAAALSQLSDQIVQAIRAEQEGS